MANQSRNDIGTMGNERVPNGTSHGPQGSAGPMRDAAPTYRQDAQGRDEFYRRAEYNRYDRDRDRDNRGQNWHAAYGGRADARDQAPSSHARDVEHERPGGFDSGRGGYEPQSYQSRGYSYGQTGSPQDYNQGYNAGGAGRGSYGRPQGWAPPSYGPPQGAYGAESHGGMMAYGDFGHPGRDNRTAYGDMGVAHGEPGDLRRGQGRGAREGEGQGGPHGWAGQSRRWRRAGQRARDVMTKSPRAVRPTDTVQQIAQIMVDEDCGIVPVVADDNRLVGVVTDRDIVCRLIARGADMRAAKASDVMTDEVECVTEQDSLHDVLRLMSEHQIRRIPVVARGDRLVGIIAMADLAREADVDEQLQDTFEEISSERSFWARLR